MNEQPSSFHPMNQPYINSGARNIRKHYHTIANGYDIQPSYESQSVLKNSTMSNDGNYMRQVYSQSSTYINTQPYEMNGEQGAVMAKAQQQQSVNQNSLQYSLSQNQQSPRSQLNQGSVSPPNNSLSNRRSIPSLTNQTHSRFTNRSQPLSQQQSSSTQLLHEKIFYLQKQLQQLTALLQQQSHNALSGHEYEQIAIENAQLTIKVQQLQEKIGRLSGEKAQIQQQLLEVGQQYERQHRINNQLRERILQLQQKITLIQKQHSIIQTTANSQQQSATTNQTHTPAPNLQLQNTRLNQQISTLLSKLHNTNIDLNEQQCAKQQLMQKMNQQLMEIEQLRKQVSDNQVQRLQLQEMNNYLKQEISQVNTMSANKLKQIQEKYIKQEMQRQMEQEEMENFNFHLQQKVQQLESEISKLSAQLQQINGSGYPSHPDSPIEKSRPASPQKSQPFKDLFDQDSSKLKQQLSLMKQQLTLLNQQLSQQKQRHNIIKTQYTQMLHNQQTQINQLQNENKKLSMQNRTLKVQIEDKHKEIEQLQTEYENMITSLNEMKVNKNLQRGQQMESERRGYQENIRGLNQQCRRLMEEKQRLERNYQVNMKAMGGELDDTKYEMQKLIRTIDNKQQQIRQKDYLAQQLYELQKSNSQLLQQVKLLQKTKLTLLEQMKQKEQGLLRRNQQGQMLVKYKLMVGEKDEWIRRLEGNVKNMEGVLVGLREENEKLKLEIKSIQVERDGLMRELEQKEQQLLQKQKLQQQQQQNQQQQNQQQQNQQQQNQQQQNQQQQNQQQQQQPQQQSYQYSSASCPLCPQVLKQFTIYKQLMQLKFQTMNELLDQMKISFIRAQFELKDQITKDKSKYEHWIQTYDSHDKEYRVLMERLWEWEKINAKNQMLREDVAGRKSRMGQDYARGVNGASLSQPESANNRKPPIQLVKQPQQSTHLSDLQYDLYLIKLQNSTLRSQITGLEKQLSQKGKSPQTQRQIEQLKLYSDNLLIQNQQLKSRLTQIVNQKKMTSSKDMFYENQQGKKQSIFQRYSSPSISKEMMERSRYQEKALASAELLINKLKKENDNLIETKRILQQQLDQQSLRNRSLQKQFELQRQKYRREIQLRAQNTQKSQVLDRYNLPIEYIRYHPEHKKLQSEYVALKRSYLEMELQYKKSKQALEQDLQKLRIENEFHQERINQLEKNQKSTNYFSFHRKSLQTNSNGQESYEKQVYFAESKVKTLQQRCKLFEKQLQVKDKQIQSYKKKYQTLMRQIEHNQSTPRNKNQSLDRIDKIVSNIQVSPIQSPQWDQSSAQQNSDRFLSIGQVVFDEKYIQKLKTCMDKKMIELEITPRQTSNLISKATWFIEKLARDIKELRNNMEILKGQRKAIMKERNDLKEKLQSIDEVQVSDRSKPFAKIKVIKAESNNQIFEESISKALNKMKISKGYQSVPKLNFDSKSQTPIQSNAEGDENFLNDIVKQTLQLKNQRRNGLKKFQQQVQNLSYS